MTQCASHKTFEELIKGSIESLAREIRDGIRAVAEQSRSNGAVLTQVVEGQARRRETCAAQVVRIGNMEDALAVNDEHHRAFWKEINALKKFVYMGLGGVLVLNALLVLAVRGVLR